MPEKRGFAPLGARAVVMAALALASAAFAAAPGGAPEPSDADLAALAAMMTGSFSSAAQAAADPENFRDIRLAVVPIWTDRDDGPWLYVEQAAATALEAPYRQRVYRLVRTGEKTIESRVYTLPDPPLRFAGAAQDPAKLAELGPDALTLRAGCAVVLEKSGQEWKGSTAGTGCASDLRGASHATSEVTITAAGMRSWDRGYDAVGKQVWGAVSGPYIFVRQ